MMTASLGLWIALAAMLGALVGYWLNRSTHYPAVPLISALLSGLLVAHLGAQSLTLCGLALLWALEALVLIDLKSQLLPDRITLPLVWAGLLINSVGGFTDLHSAVWGAVAGYVFLWAVYWGYWWLTRREGMGFGDFKLMAALGAWLGWQVLPAILLLASLTGALVGGFWLWRRGQAFATPIPFGPFIAVAGYGAMLMGKGGLW
jgi:leader peptidase (prepilin peptidase)/N-methyltransferase